MRKARCSQHRASQPPTRQAIGNRGALKEGFALMLAHNDTAVTTALSHPAWCTAEHRGATPSLHQSPDMLLGHIVDVPVTVQRVHIDPEPGFPEARDEIWLGVGPHYTEVPLDEAADIATQLRTIAASLELLLGGA